MSQTVSTIDYKALAERLSSLADEFAAFGHHTSAQRVDDLRTVVSLLEGMADDEPVARIYTDAELVHRDPRWGRVCWIVPECEIDGGALLYLHPAPQPQTERQPVSELTEAQLDAVAAVLFDLYCAEGPQAWAAADAVLRAAPDLLAALKPFAHPDLCVEMGGNVEGDNSPIYARNGALLRLGDFRRAAAAVAKAKGGNK